MKSKKLDIKTNWLTGLVLSLAIFSGSCDALNQLSEDLNDEEPLGEWRVTEITGSITDERVGGGIEFFCDYYEDTYTPIQDDDQTFILFLNRRNNPYLGNIPPDVFGATNLPDNEGGVFIFYFSFTNGYFTNEVLEDFGVQCQYAEIIQGAWDFEVGFWTDDRVEGEMKTGTASGGISTFKVIGEFTSETRIESEWSFEENTVLPGGESPECNTAATGSGSWTAIRI